MSSTPPSDVNHENPDKLRHNNTQNISDVIAVDMISHIMNGPMTQQQKFVVSQIMKYPDQMNEIIEAAMKAGVDAPVLKKS